MRIVIVILAAALDLQAQVISGSVRDRQSGELLPYATIGIKGKAIGGIADRNGKFTIDLSKASQRDSLIARYLGFKHFAICVADLTAGQILTIQLVPETRMLQEVLVYDKKALTTMGNDRKSFYHTGWGDNESERGRTRGLLINKPEFPIFLVSFHMHIHENTFDSVRFRLQLLDAEEPFRPLLTENVFITTAKNKGWIEFDLKPYQIKVTGSFVLAVEWVDAWGKPKGPDEFSHILTMSEAKPGGKIYSREKPEEIIRLQEHPLLPSFYVKGIGAR
jgi:hypothetical protein